MKIIIAGGRDFNNYNVLCAILNSMRKLPMYYGPKLEEIVSGDAKGADTLGAYWAIEHNIPVKHFPAEWDKYGKSAGFIRNAEMAEYADALIAFWDGKSKGTRHMIKTMQMKKKPYRVFNYNGEEIMKGG